MTARAAKDKVVSALRKLDSPTAPLWYFTILVAALFVYIIVGRS